ncbi:MAG: NADPH-dependent glutamate synthase [Bryobacteraceae bacterium]
MEKPRVKRNPKIPRQVLPLLEPQERARDREVACGFDVEKARQEALRCLDCRDPKCIDACPIHTDIRSFIARLVDDDFLGAYQVLEKTNPFPGICGRVCQYELYCEKDCLMGKKLESVAIGSLERFVADYHREFREGEKIERPELNGLRVALVGSGPASLICANDLTRNGYAVTVFEALHELGGVLAYGIPPFRLPRDIIREEIDRLRALGVEFRTNYIVGRTQTIDELFEEGYAAIFVGTGAGLPFMMGIPGENLIGCYTANEFLTRINLMHAYETSAETPVRVGSRTIVIGGGNSAMDAARWAKRLGSETTILFRRGRAELRAREEEIEHAEEEGVKFEFLGAPVRLIGDANNLVCAMKCIRMKLGEPDDSGRPSPVPIPGSEYTIPVETVVAAIGQAPNPTLQRATPQLITKRGKIVIDQKGETSLPGVFAGGDVVRGGSTVILAMKDGRLAAEAIDRSLRQQFPENFLEPGYAAGITFDTPDESFRLLRKTALAPEITRFEVHAPRIAAKWKAGQFVILRPTAESERIPLTLVASNHNAIILIVQSIGKTTRLLASLEEGDRLADLLGPLGKAARAEKVGTVMCVAGGVGVAEVLPVAQAFSEAGNHVVLLCGARSDHHRILDEELRATAGDLRWATDDGSFGFPGNVVELMKAWREEQARVPDLVHVIGPIPMMSAAAKLTREWGARTVASLNPIMVDGTGMCGGCRVSVGNEVKFACVDGPEFDAHGVDFNELTLRNRAYRDHEQKVCQLDV